MPEVTYTGGGHFRVAGCGFDSGATQDVDDELAQYLAGRDDFDVHDSEDTSDEESDDLEYEEASAIEDRLDAGECPWCSEYDGENVGQHASSAHPDKWTAYKEA